ncbi:MAG: glycosyltransferase family 4 protein [Chitinophagaceae bacterium]
MPGRFVAQKVQMRHLSKGFWNRVFIVFQAWRYQGEINHVTGDIHFATLLLNKKRTVLTIHDCRLLDEWNGIKYKLFRLFWFQLPLKKCQYITVVSTFTSNRLKHHLKVNDEKIRVIPVAIDERFKPLKKDFNSQRPIVLQVGTTVNKNLHRVAAALEGVTCQLRIIGDLSNEDITVLDKYKIAYTSISNISIDEVIQEYGNADMLLFASTYEGFGMPILEAQSTGRPVITSNIASMPEVSGEGAALVDPYNIASIRNAVVKLIHDANYRNDLIQKGFINVNRFRINDIAEKYAELYDAIGAQR